MPQVDLVSACSGGVSNDRKIACETLADDDPPPSDQPDLPADSFFPSPGAELDWIDRNAFIERNESANGGILVPSVSADPIVNPPSPPTNPVLSVSGSQRHSVNLKSKPSIIGLMKPQKAGGFTEAKNRRPASIRLFPKRSNSSSSKSGRKSGVSAEPSSPKVSCIGRVRSRKDRSRRKKTGRQKKSEQTVITRSKSQRGGGGFWHSFRCIFRSRPRKQPKKVSEPAIEPAGGADPPPLGVVKRFSSARRSDAWAADLETSAAKSEPSDLDIGGLRRFPSRRRSDAWAGDLDGGGTKSEPLDPPSIGAVKRFSSARRSDAWAADLEVDVEKLKPSDPPNLGAVRRFTSGRRSDAWAGELELEVEGAKSEPLDQISVFQRRIDGAQ